jgi:DNA-binding MltR family transcriptional regulator
MKSAWEAQPRTFLSGLYRVSRRCWTASPHRLADRWVYLKMTKAKVDPLSDWKGFYEELQNESPRAAVIIAAAFLDAQLRNLLSTFLIDDPQVVDELLGTGENAHGPLSSFWARIRAAYSMGLISRSMYDDLDSVRKIRNKFGHKMHGYTFDEPEIVSWCKNLKLAKMITDVSPRLPKSHRAMFLLGVAQLASWLALRTPAARKARRSIPKDPTMGQVVRVE